RRSVTPLCTRHYTLIYLLLNGAATTVMYPLSLHDALPILLEAELIKYLWLEGSSLTQNDESNRFLAPIRMWRADNGAFHNIWMRSEEHTSELQSRENLVCRLLLEKKKTQHTRQQDALVTDE